MIWVTPLTASQPPFSYTQHTNTHTYMYMYMYMLAEAVFLYLLFAKNKEKNTTIPLSLTPSSARYAPIIFRNSLHTVFVTLITSCLFLCYFVYQIFSMWIINFLDGLRESKQDGREGRGGGGGRKRNKVCLPFRVGQRLKPFGFCFKIWLPTRYNILYSFGGSFTYARTNMWTVFPYSSCLLHTSHSPTLPFFQWDPPGQAAAAAMVSLQSPHTHIHISTRTETVLWSPCWHWDMRPIYYYYYYYTYMYLYSRPSGLDWMRNGDMYPVRYDGAGFSIFPPFPIFPFIPLQSSRANMWHCRFYRWLFVYTYMYILFLLYYVFWIQYGSARRLEGNWK